MDMTIEALTLFIKSLPASSRFEIISFGTKFQCLSEQICPDQGYLDYTDDNVDKAIKSVRTFKADLGGTEIYLPLNHATKKREDENTFKNKIFLLTDGAVSQPDKVI